MGLSSGHRGTLKKNIGGCTGVYGAYLGFGGYQNYGYFFGLPITRTKIFC